MGFDRDELERYARHIVLHEIGGPGQQRIKAAKVLVIGAGGLGSPAILYLAAAGVGRIGIVDDDEVSLSNLQRQVLHHTDEVGEPKVASAARAVARLNPHVEVVTHDARLTPENADGIVAGYDMVLDGSDNFDTRYLVNRAAARAAKPLVFAAIGRWEGQVAVFDPAAGGPCYECIFPERPAPGLVPACAEAGVLGAMAGVVGAMQAVEAVKLIAQAGEPLRGRLMLYDALGAEARVIRVKPRADCPVCGDASRG
ncbi:molybdopterin-synthase adenylyltransferase MoeB [Limibaculum sp. M0105]|uniref:Molybdopterin-synthase adenylyltransferase n=1 Tax=Thermohalobaculum xanthum TaxID=2753746 RepID=A0A8J7M877_9RHOB|nr:molybdopterin-synthase adenylyltransferase MoeB [Thermohalobaculum xanthum]